ncbi:MAG TPA: hypothetical protein VGR56_05170 [Nitrososphaerales archaeon]|nr:hypothetical protein [Nitrososphaerales archaeon]
MRPLRIKNSFIPWSFPEIVAKEEGLFEKAGLDVSFYALDPAAVEPSNKPSWYKGLTEEGKVDAYSCCAWAALDRLSDGGKNKIVGATSSLDYAFTIMVPPDSRVKEVTDLADVEILVNLRTGSHYCNLRQLEDEVPYEHIRLVHGGAPQNRLLALMDGSAQAAALISPYTEVAAKLGFREVFKTSMVDVLAYVARSDLPESEVSSFLTAVEEAVNRIRADPARYKPQYMKVLKETLSGYPDEYKAKALAAAGAVEASVNTVQWGPLKPYAKETFSTIETWMESHSLLEKPITYDQLVNNKPLEEALGAASR